MVSSSLGRFRFHFGTDYDSLLFVPGGTVERLVEIKGRSVFSLQEARSLLPIIRRITGDYSARVDALIERLDAVAGHNDTLAMEIERKINTLILEWQGKVERLGGLPKGLWIADFDSGNGYYCWKYPERSIDFWHKYTDGFTRRIHVDDLLPKLVADAASAP